MKENFSHVAARFFLMLALVFGIFLGFFSYFTNSNLKDATQRLDHATEQLDSARLNLKQAQITVTQLHESLSGFKTFLSDNENKVEAMNNDYRRKLLKLEERTAKMARDLEKYKAEINRINPPQENLKLNVTDR